MTGEGQAEPNSNRRYDPDEVAEAGAEDAPLLDDDGIEVPPPAEAQPDPADTYAVRVRDNPTTKKTEATLGVWAPMGVPLWEQMPHEPDEYYDLFSTYRDLPRKKRSLGEAGALMGRSVDWMTRLAQRYAWFARTKAFDQERALQNQLASFAGPDYADTAGTAGAVMGRAAVDARQQALASMPTYRERASQRLQRHVEQKFAAGSVITNLFFERVLAAAAIVRDETTGEWKYDEARRRPLEIKDKDWPAWARLGNDFTTQAMQSMGVPLSLAPTVEAVQDGEGGENPTQEQQTDIGQAHALIQMPVSFGGDLSAIPSDQLRAALEASKRVRNGANGTNGARDE
jgi:hypothetical protein